MKMNFKLLKFAYKKYGPLKVCRNFLEYVIFLLLFNLIKIIPLFLIPKLGSGIGLLVYITKLRKAVVLKNLEIAFHDTKSRDEIKSICKSVYKNLGQTLLEVLLMYWIKPAHLHRFIELEGSKILKDALNEGKGAIVVTGHFGNWELQSAALSTFVEPMYGYAGRQQNLFFDQKINQIRKKFDMQPITKSKSSTREMLKVILEKKLLGIIADLNVPADHLFVEFFNKPASIGAGIAHFTLRKQSPLFFAYTKRIGPLKHKSKIVKLDYEITGNREANILSISQSYMNHLETVIKKNPELYFWVNKRWKTRPENDHEQIYAK